MNPCFADSTHTDHRHASNSRENISKTSDFSLCGCQMVQRGVPEICQISRANFYADSIATLCYYWCTCSCTYVSGIVSAVSTHKMLRNSLLGVRIGLTEQEIQPWEQGIMQRMSFWLNGLNRASGFVIQSLLYLISYGISKYIMSRLSFFLRFPPSIR